MNNEILTISLPYPPSVNHLYFNASTGRVMRQEGRVYKQAVLAAVLRALNGRPAAYEGRLGLDIAVYFPDRRKRDLDNLIKITQDSLTSAGVWLDDKQIKDLHIWQAGMQKGGKLEVTVRTLPDLLEG